MGERGRISRRINHRDLTANDGRQFVLVMHHFACRRSRAINVARHTRSRLSGLPAILYFPPSRYSTCFAIGYNREERKKKG